MAGPGRIFEDIKAKIYDKFIQLFVLSKAEVIDRPGFIICRFTSGSYDISLREFVFPEKLFSNLERAVADKFGDAGKQALYSAGKRFGYRYATISNLATLKRSGEKGLKKELYEFIRYIETIYAEGIRHTIDTKQKIFDMEMNQYVVCRLNGLGCILTEGAVIGTIAYMLDDATIEGTQTHCQGRGDKLCKLVCAPKRILKKRQLKFFEEEDYSDLELGEDYSKMNEMRACKFATQSFKGLVDSGLYKYSPGVAKFGDERYFFCESTIMYLVELELQKIGGEEVMFDVAFDTGKQLGEKYKSYGAKGFLTDYLSSLGYGDINQVSKTEVSADYFPWTHYVHDIKFAIFRGLVSGLLSGLYGKDVKLKRFKISEDEGFLNVFISK